MRQLADCGKRYNVEVNNLVPVGDKLSNVNELVQRLTEASDAYHDGESLMSDAVYDQLEDELRSLAPDHPFLKRIGAPPKNGAWPKVKHEVEMGSLNKAWDRFERHDWWIRTLRSSFINPHPVVVSEKLDGISCDTRYRDGNFYQAVTRGDGSVGDDITRNVFEMKGIIHTIPNNFTGNVRGEVICCKDDFDKYFSSEKNRRNTAAGKAKKFGGVEHRHLTFMAYRVIPVSGSFPTKMIEFKALRRAGFITPNYYFYDDVNTTHGQVTELYENYVNHKREKLNYDIDGLVVEVDDREYFDEAGDLNGCPTAAIAFKFPSDKAETTLRDDVWQVGNTGRVTPVAIFDMVKLAGVEVERASLHNISKINELLNKCGVDFEPCGGIPKGTVIIVSRRGDVIPYVESIVMIGSGDMLPAPLNCPSCGGEIERDGEYLVCRNDECPAQVSGYVKIWINKVGVLEWGGTIIDALVEQEFITEPADLYALEQEQLATLKLKNRILGPSAAETMLNHLHAKKELPLHVFVGSLGIPLCARSVCRLIVDAGYDTLEKMINVSVEALMGIHGIGDEKAEAFHRGIRVKASVIARLEQEGVRPVAPLTEGVLLGKTVCMTGFRSPALTEAIEEAGGIVKTSVVKNLDYLVAKTANSTSTKAKKARAQGTVIMGKEDIWNLLQDQ